MSTTPAVFLSYSHEDVPAARRFAEALEREGLEVWWDVMLRSGEAYDQVIEDALKAARAVVVLWSSRSVISRWVRAEATLADRNKTLVPVMIEACDCPIMFELTQTADLTRWQGAREDPTWLGLLADVRRLVAVERTASNAVPRAEPAVGPAPVAAKGERGEAPSLAVPPFTNRSGQPEDDVYAIGMVEDVIDALSQGVNVRVAASAATARYEVIAMLHSLWAQGEST